MDINYISIVQSSDDGWMFDHLIESFQRGIIINWN